jgi:hypothetical protein
MPAVYFIYALDEERSFWALWPNRAAFDHEYAPQTYAMTRDHREKIDLDIRAMHPQGICLEPALEIQQAIYRRVRRSELPWEVQQKIHQAIRGRNQHRSEHFAEMGFCVEHYQSKKALKKRFRELAQECHPDRGGSAVQFMQLKQAYQELLRRFFL